MDMIFTEGMDFDFDCWLSYNFLYTLLLWYSSNLLFGPASWAILVAVYFLGLPCTLHTNLESVDSFLLLCFALSDQSFVFR